MLGGAGGAGLARGAVDMDGEGHAGVGVGGPARGPTHNVVLSRPSFSKYPHRGPSCTSHCRAAAHAAGVPWIPMSSTIAPDRTWCPAAVSAACISSSIACWPRLYAAPEIGLPWRTPVLLNIRGFGSPGKQCRALQYNGYCNYNKTVYRCITTPCYNGVAVTLQK